MVFILKFFFKPFQLLSMIQYSTILLIQLKLVFYEYIFWALVELYWFRKYLIIMVNYPR